MKKIISILFTIIYVNSGFAVVYTERPSGFKPVVEVSACFLQKDGKFLFLHRQDNKSQGNTWGIPGGKVEKQETPLNAVVRELREETGISLHPEAVTHIKTVYITNDVSYVYHMYEAAYSGSSAITIDPTEHKDYVWVSLAEALKMELMDDEAPCIEIAYPTVN